MTQEKMRKVITAVASAATMLLVVLLAVLIYQWVTMGNQNRDLERLDKEIAELEQQAQENEADAAWYEGPGQYWLAIEKGWILNQGDK